MDTIGNVAQELVFFGRQHGVDLEPLRTLGAFSREGRWVIFWRKDYRPCTGLANEPLGTLHYNMQGSISSLPSCLRGSQEAFRGVWSESGSLDGDEQALNLINSWLVDRKEVDELPERQLRRCGI